MTEKDWENLGKTEKDWVARQQDDETARQRDNETTRPRDDETAKKHRRSQPFSGVLSRAWLCAVERG